MTRVVGSGTEASTITSSTYPPSESLVPVARNSETVEAELARDVGFGETMRMYDVFRRELGVTPSEYRKERQVP